VILVQRSVRVYFATQPTNLRMSFEGLSNQVREVLRYDPVAGHIFVFLNSRKTMVKLLVYTRGGYRSYMSGSSRGGSRSLPAWSMAPRAS
jgi:transposase